MAIVGEITGSFALSRMRERMLADETGRRILKERPLISSELLKSMSTCPEGSFGRAYADFMTRHKITADTRMPVRFCGQRCLGEF